MPKPRQGTEVKKHRSIRIEDSVLAKILSKDKKLQNWIDRKIREEGLQNTPDKKE